MVAYLTDLEHEKALRAILLPISENLRPNCGNRMSLDIRKGQYGFSELHLWASRASTLLKFNEDTKIPGVYGTVGVPYFENRISCPVEKDDMIPQVKQVLREHNITLEAFHFTSKESELKAKTKALASFSTAPEIHRNGSDEQVVVAAVRLGGEKAAELIMGETTLNEVLRILPPFPGHGPKKLSRKVNEKLSAEIKQLLDRIEQSYNPAATQTIVGFNRNKKLIYVLNMVERQQAERFAQELDALTDMSEVSRDSNSVLSQGKLTSCVIVQTTTIVEQGEATRVNGAAYFYTCKT
jgi:hypothetical protein